MKKEWYAAKELVGIGGFPTTPQAINQRAKAEGWRKQRRSGVQGRAIEYHISSFPPNVVAELAAREDSQGYQVEPPNTIKAWSAIYYQLTDEERELLTTFVMREGINSLFERLGLERRSASMKEKPELECEE